MKNAQDILTALETDRGWINQIVKQYADSKYWPYATTDAKLFREVTIRKPTGKTNRFGDTALKRFRLDGVAVIKVNDHRYHPILCGLEVKVTSADLFSDQKMSQYCTHVDTFYIAVPDELYDDAQRYVAEYCKPAGILTISRDGVVRLRAQAANLHNGEQQIKEMCCELLMKSLWKEAKQKNPRRKP